MFNFSHQIHVIKGRRWPNNCFKWWHISWRLLSFFWVSLSIHGFSVIQSMPLHPCNIFGLRSCKLNNSVSVVLLFSVIQIQPNLQFYEHFEKMRSTKRWKPLSLHVTGHSAQKMPSTRCGVQCSVCQPQVIEMNLLLENGFSET